MNPFPNKAQKLLDQRMASENFRELCDHSDLIDFFSNDYLSFNEAPYLLDKLRNYINKEQIEYGSTGSRLVSGNRREMEKLEQFFAHFFKGEAALFFSSGFNANLALFSSIASKKDTIIYDALIHASIREGIRLSPARSFGFNHNDLSDLEIKLDRATGDIFVAVESLYSMDGDFANLKRIAELCEKKGAYLIVDEAHSTGIYNEDGSGYTCQLGLEQDVFARVMTFGKGLSCHGATIVGSNKLRDFLINFGKSFIYTTAPDLLSMKKVKWAIQYRRDNPALQEELFQNIAYFLKLQKKYFPFKETFGASPIQTIQIPGSKQAKAAEQILIKNGIATKAILSPTVPEGMERLRVCIHRNHTKEDIHAFWDYLGKILTTFQSQ